MKKMILLLALVYCWQSGWSQDVLQFRGHHSTGVYESKSLLNVWPEDGPPMLWECSGIGNGYGSPVIHGNTIFVNGEIDSITYLFALNINGEVLWKRPIGEEWVQSFRGARSTPTIRDGYVYVSAGMGNVACFDAAEGGLIWQINLIDDYGGVLNRFGYSESIVTYNDMVFCMPGGEEHNVIALNRFTGALVWSAPGMGEMPAFSTPLIVEYGEKVLYISYSAGHLLCLNALSGELLWVHGQQGEGDVHVNTPLLVGESLYYVAGNGNGAVKLTLSRDGREISEAWSTMRFDNLMGGFVKKGDHLYGSGERRRFWYSLHADSGEIVDSVRFDKGVSIMAEGLLYAYNSRGDLALFAIGDGRFEQRGELKVTGGTEAHFSHPVISSGILYVRRGNSLMAWDIRIKPD